MSTTFAHLWGVPVVLHPQQQVQRQPQQRRRVAHEPLQVAEPRRAQHAHQAEAHAQRLRQPFALATAAGVGRCCGTC
jgi:negative regulator of sigma E activity